MMLTKYRNRVIIEKIIISMLFIVVLMSLFSCWDNPAKNLRTNSRCIKDDYFKLNKREFINLDMEKDNEKITPQYQLIKKVVDPNSSFFVDVGVNRGDFTNVLLKFAPNAKVDAFDVIQKFVDNVNLRFVDNGNVNVMHYAMTDGSDPGYVDIKGMSSWNNDASFHTGASILTRNKDHKTVLERVKTSTLDSFYFKKMKRINFLKIDTEGFDARVLHGANSLLKYHLVDFVFFENNKMQREIGDSLFKTVQFMDGHGYRCYLFGSKHSVFLNDLCETNDIFQSDITTNVYCL